MPPVGRYGPSGTPFSMLHQPHIQQHPQSQQHHHSQAHNSGLPLSGVNAGFGSGNPNANSNLNPFTISNTPGGLHGGLSGVAGSDGAGGSLGAQAHQGFMRGAQIQQQQQQMAHEAMGNPGTPRKGLNSRFRDVWKHNLAHEMEVLRGLVEKYPYISMDTEFPGIVARPMGSFTTKADYHYQTLRCNVDLLKMIQLGITLFSPEGELPPAHSIESNPYLNNLPPEPFTWQFNFKFSLENDMYAQESTSMLQKAGIDFEKHDSQGIDPNDFGALLMTSGLVLLDDVHWISFHSGYDFGYLMKIMLCKPLPDDEVEFHKLLNIFFPSVYDIKFLVKHAMRNQVIDGNSSQLSPHARQVLSNITASQKSGLQDIAEELGIKRIGVAHQAGSDSLVTGELFWKMRQVIFNGVIDEEKYSGKIWGLNGVMPALPPSATPNLNGATIYTNGGTPSTPHNLPAGLTSNHTPGPQHQENRGMGSLTPSGGGGVFGAFQFNKPG